MDMKKFVGKEVVVVSKKLLGEVRGEVVEFLCGVLLIQSADWGFMGILVEDVVSINILG